MYVVVTNPWIGSDAWQFVIGNAGRISVFPHSSYHDRGLFDIYQSRLVIC